MMSRSVKVAVAATAVMLAAGCGGGGGGADATSNGAETLRVGDTAGVPSLFLLYGVERGHFEKQGLDLEVEQSSGGSTVLPALMSGDLDVAGSNVVSVMIAADSGLPISMVAAGTSTADTTEEDFSAIVVLPESPTKEVADLKGKRVAVNTLKNINDIVIGGQLEKAGLQHDGATFVEIPFPEMSAALDRGDVDAAMMIEPFYTMGADKGYRTIDRPYSGLNPGLQIGTYAMASQKVQQDPELADKFLAGVQATADDIAEDPETFRAALPELGEVSEEAAADMHLPVWRGKTDRESVELIGGLMEKYGLIKESVEFDALIRS